jgi:hypothetical protein
MKQHGGAPLLLTRPVLRVRNETGCRDTGLLLPTFRQEVYRVVEVLLPHLHHAGLYIFRGASNAPGPWRNFPSTEINFIDVFLPRQE